MKAEISDLEKIQDLEDPNIELEDEEIVEELTEAVKILLDKSSWIKNIQIENKISERESFKEARKNGKNFKPNFEFKKFPYEEKKLLNILNQFIEASKQISENDLEQYEAKTIFVKDLQEFFTRIFEELKLYVKLAANIEDESKWKEYSKEIWSIPEKETVENSREKLQELEEETLEKNVKPEELREMFEDEVERLEIEYNVEIRQVSGCHNIPEEKTVVVASGENGERTYSQKEAKMLTMHEIFHVIRGYNGLKAGKESSFPEILGLHTPFYDQTEEGGAIFREHATETSYKNKEFDYHLRLVAAYELANCDNYREEFSDIVEKLIELGGSINRSFYLVARNREALRHHIYQAGYLEEWENREEKWPLLIGKLNEKWADKFKEEVEAGGMIQGPEIGEEKLFNFSFKDSSHN